MAEALAMGVPGSLIKQLTDKVYERRKASALELERMIRECVRNNQTETVDKIISIMGELITSATSHARKGGLLGFAAIAIAMGSPLSAQRASQLIVPVLSCMSDSESRVRYYACESLYNIMKATREMTLQQFQPLFNALCELSADPEQQVRNGADLVDRLLKDIVISSDNFEVGAFMCLLRERIYTQNEFVKCFLITWVQTLQSNPDFKMASYVPGVLDGLFQILGDPSNKTRTVCKEVLTAFLEVIIKEPVESDIKSMVPVLVVNAKSKDNQVKLMALMWLRDFLSLDTEMMLNYVGDMLSALLPCIGDTSREREEIMSATMKINSQVMTLVESKARSSAEVLDIPRLIDVLLKNLFGESVRTKVTALEWINCLYLQMPVKVSMEMENLFRPLLGCLSDPSDEVVAVALSTISQLCTGKEGGKITFYDLGLPVSRHQYLKDISDISPYFMKFILGLLEKFYKHESLLLNRGAFIVCRLCSCVNSRDVFRTFAASLRGLPALFVGHVVSILTSTLMTAPELLSLRTLLKDGKDEKSQELFRFMYPSWCCEPVSLLTLCLYTQNYALAADLVEYLSKSEPTLEFLIEIDKLVQLLESLIFTHVRHHLLFPRRYPHLQCVLRGLLMVLPQSVAFEMLSKRLQVVPVMDMTDIMKSRRNEPECASCPDVDGLLNSFNHIQELIKEELSRNKYHPFLFE